jgi:transposase
MPRYFGLDVHKDVVQVCCLDDTGKVLTNARIPCTREALTAWADAHLAAEDHVALEATTNTWAVVDLLATRAARLVVSNPLKTKAIASARVKTDRVDAKVLAQLLRVDFLPGVWVPDPRTLRLRQLTHRRAGLSADATAVKNRIHATLHMRLIRPPVDDLFRAAGRAWLADVPLDPDGRAAVDGDLRVLAAIEAEIERADLAVRQVAYADDRAKLLMTLPGVSYLTAVTLLAAWGDPARFPDADHAVAYLGLVPSTRQSGSSCHHGPITKEGSAHARHVLVQAAHMAGRHPGPLGVAFRRLAKRKNPNVAVVACARKLARVAWLMLSTGEPYRYALPDTTRAKLARLRRSTGERRPSVRRNRYATPPEMLDAGFHASIIPPITDVLISEGVPPPTPPGELPAGERKMLSDRELDAMVRAIHAPKYIPRPKRDRSRKMAEDSGKEVLTET